MTNCAADSVTLKPAVALKKKSERVSYNALNFTNVWANQKTKKTVNMIKNINGRLEAFYHHMCDFS